MAIAQSAAQRRGDTQEKPQRRLTQSAAQRRGDAPGWMLKEPCSGCDDKEEKQTPAKKAKTEAGEKEQFE